nr:MAG TPA: hypothetical protein [Caudoviricetes sp.]
MIVWHKNWHIISDFNTFFITVFLLFFYSIENDFKEYGRT